MPSVFNGILTGSGTKHISDGGVTVTDIDYWVDTIGPQVGIKGPAPHRLLTNVGWIQFYNSTYDTLWTGQPPETCSDPYWFNYEAADVGVSFPVGDQATDFVYFVQALSSVHLNVSTP